MIPSTDALRIRPDSPAHKKLREVESGLLHGSRENATDDVRVLFDSPSPFSRSVTSSMAAAVLTAFGYVLRPGESGSIDPLQIAITRSLEEREKEHIADFFEPTKYNWNKYLCRARVAAREYSEHTHVDY